MQPPHPPINCDLLDKWIERTKNNKGDLEAEMNAKWLNANSKKCPKCRSAIEKTYGCNWMKCSSCQHGFCWLCLGDEAAHPGRAGNHALQCNNAADVKKKGREAFMNENNFDAGDLDGAASVFAKANKARE